jgi:hypothetical protein
LFISHKYKIIFIHIQKTGGTSIEKLIEAADPELIKSLQITPSKRTLRHSSLSEIKAGIAENVFNRYKKVCVVRNPFDRMVSWYAMLKHKSHDFDFSVQPPGFREIGETIVNEVSKHASCFEEFLLLPRDHESGLFQRFYMNQLDYISEEGIVLADNILRFEHLESDVDKLVAGIGIEGKLPHVNQSIREKSYRNCYTETTKKIIFERFEKDLEYFKYDF